jgi:hypothetical protein
MQQLIVRPETALVRPFVVAAILRGVSFDPVKYDSFIDLQVGVGAAVTGHSRGPREQAGQGWGASRHAGAASMAVPSAIARSGRC